MVVLDLTLKGFLIAYLCHTILALMIISHTAPTIGIQLRQVTKQFKTIGHRHHVRIAFIYALIKQHAVDMR